VANEELKSLRKTWNRSMPSQKKKKTPTQKKGLSLYGFILINNFLTYTTSCPTLPFIIMLSLTKIKEGLEVCHGLKWKPLPFLI